MGAANGETVVRGSQRVSGWEYVGDGVWKVPWSINSQQLFMNGEHLVPIGSTSPWNATNSVSGRPFLPKHGEIIDDLITNSFMIDARTETLYCRLRDDIDPNQQLVEASVADFIIDGGTTTSVEIRNVRFEHSNGTAKGGRSCLIRSGRADWSLVDVTAADGDFAGVCLRGENHTMRSVRIIRNGAVGIDINGSWSAAERRHRYGRPSQGILIDDVEIVFNNWRRFDSFWHAGGIKCIPLCRGVTVTNSVIAGNTGPGIWFDASLGDNVVVRNRVEGNEAGIVYEVSGPSDGDTFGAVIADNIVTDNSQQGIYVSASTGTRVEHNTVIGNRFGIVLHGMPRRHNGVLQSLANNVVVDNIVGRSDVDVVIYGGRAAADNHVDENFYVSRSQGRPTKRAGVRVSVVEGTGYTITDYSLDGLYGRTGFEEHGHSGDPRWEDTKSFRPDRLGDAARKGKRFRSEDTRHP